MGFFNFLYKLSNICTNKKKLKFFIVVGLIFLLLLSLHNKGYCSEATDSDALSNYEIYLQQSAIFYLRSLKKTGNITIDNYNHLMNYMKTWNIYVTTSKNDNAQFIIYLYLINVDTNAHYNDVDDFTIDGSWSIGVLQNGTVSGTEFPCKLGQFYGYSYVLNRSGVSGLDTLTAPQWTSFYLPAPCYCVRSTAVNDYLEEINAYSELPTTYNTSDAELQAISSSGFATLNTSINNQTQTMTNSINNATSTITNSIDSIENTLTDTTTDDTQVTFAQDTNEDLTYNFFSNLFSQYTDTFTRPQIRLLRIKFPFTDKYLTMNNYYFQNNILSDEKYTNLIALVHSFWWFSLGMYVLYDVYNKINKIKSGDLTNIENENITTQLL